MTIANTGTLAAAPESVDGSVTRAAKKGEFVTIYCTGLGGVNNPPLTGSAAMDETSTTKSPVSVLLNDITVTASYAETLSTNPAFFC